MFSFTKSKEEEKIDDIYIGDLFEHEIENENNNDFENESKLENESENESEFENESENESDNDFYSDNDDGYYRIINFELFPFIFTEKYEDVDGSIQDSLVSHFSFLDIINNGIISEVELKQIEYRIKDRLASLLFVDMENIKLEINKNSDSCFIFDCYIKICEEEFNALILDRDQTIQYTNKKYRKLYNIDENEDYDYFERLADYLKLYLKNIYGYREYSRDISTIIEENFTKHRINPFVYNQNIIPFKKIITKTKNDFNMIIMKMGFVLGDVEEI